MQHGRWSGGPLRPSGSRGSRHREVHQGRPSPVGPLSANRQPQAHRSTGAGGSRVSHVDTFCSPSIAPRAAVGVTFPSTPPAVLNLIVTPVDTRSTITRSPLPGFPFHRSLDQFMQRVHAIIPAESHSTRQWNRFGWIVGHSENAPPSWLSWASVLVSRRPRRGSGALATVDGVPDGRFFLL